MKLLVAGPPLSNIAGYPIAATARKRLKRARNAKPHRSWELPHLGWRLAIPGLSVHCRVRILGESQQFRRCLLGASDVFDEPQNAKKNLQESAMKPFLRILQTYLEGFWVHMFLFYCTHLG